MVLTLLWEGLSRGVVVLLTASLPSCSLRVRVPRVGDGGEFGHGSRHKVRGRRNFAFRFLSPNSRFTAEHLSCYLYS
jgi:hypothetical protein